MAGSSFNSADVLVTAANILYAPLGTNLPDETSVDWNDFASWPAAWKHMGYTNAAARTTYSYDVAAVNVEQSTAPIAQRKENETAVTDISLVQFNGDNIALLLDGTASTVAAGSGQKGWTKVVTGGLTNLKEYMFALEGFRPDVNGNEQPVRIFFYRGTVRINGSIEFAKATQTALPAQITALLDSGKTAGAQLMEVHIITAPATA